MDVVLRSSRCELVDGFDPRYSRTGLDVQVMQRVASSQVLEIEAPDQPPRRLFRVFVSVGIRWVSPVVATGKRKKKAGAAEPAPEVRATIEATFAADYRMKGEVDKTALDEFALYNAPFNVWPFWREYVSTQGNRMGLPRTVMPLQCLSAMKAASSADVETTAPLPRRRSRTPSHQ
ncbi:MAG: preprotein translocase subunit SecB [Rhodanobacter sp.]|nr:MAG: preprotein translocase subunit SecB [Rhodanobacter sp.]TAM09924.1 MAG: preprotein translocase subunit SecB [Rhodanobacter sp.]